jgi:hypothetical protein
VNRHGFRAGQWAGDRKRPAIVRCAWASIAQTLVYSDKDAASVESSGAINQAEIS